MSQERNNLSRLLNPAGIAVVGASSEPTRIGGQPIRALKEFGYSGKIYPVNPKYDSIQELVCYPDVSSVPQPCDVALIAVNAKLVADAIIGCGKAGIPYAVVLSAGFREIGDAGMALQKDLNEAIAVSGVRVVGPNCQGYMSLAHAVYCGFGAPFQYPHTDHGSVAMVTQSGGFGYAVMGLAEGSGIGFNYVVSTGNEADIDVLQLCQQLIGQDDVDVLAVYMEGVRDGRRLRVLGQQALQLRKPIVVWKVGNSALGRKAAASHTANLTASYDLYRAAFREGGFVEVRDVHDLVDVARAFLPKKFPAGNGVCVISISGGAGVLLADRCEELGLTLPSMSEDTMTALREILPTFSSILNPIDVTAQLFNDLSMLNRVIEIVANDADIHQIIVVSASVQGAMAAKIAKEIIAIAQRTDKPILVCSSALPQRAAEAFALLDAAKVPFFPTPSRAATAAAALYDFSMRVRAVRDAKLDRQIPKADLQLPANKFTLGEYQSKAILRQYDIPVVREILVPLAEVQSMSECPIAFPLVAKLESAQLPHKTEAGAVRVGINSAEELQQAVAEMIESARRYQPDAEIEGILLQEMVSGIETIVGALVDPYFGPTVLFGLGGVFAEVMRDVTYRFAPFDQQTALEMIGEIKGAKILSGYRGKPAADVQALAKVLSRLSYLIADHKDKVSEVDVNPLFVRSIGDGVVAADALVILNHA